MIGKFNKKKTTINLKKHQLSIILKTLQDETKIILEIAKLMNKKMMETVKSRNYWIVSSQAKANMKVKERITQIRITLINE